MSCVVNWSAVDWSAVPRLGARWQLGVDASSRASPDMPAAPGLTQEPACVRLTRVRGAALRPVAWP